MAQAVGLYLCVASLVLYAAAALRGVKGARGGKGAEHHGVAFLAMSGGVPTQALGLALLYAGLGRAPTTWVDGALLAGWVAGVVALLLGRRRDAAPIFVPLAAVAAACSTLVLAVPGLRTMAPSDMPWLPLHVVAGVGATGLALGAFAVAAFRLLRRPKGGVTMTMVALLLTASACLMPWGGGGERPFTAMAGDPPSERLAAAVTLSVREGGMPYVRDVPVRVDLPVVGTLRTLAGGAAVVAFLLLILHLAVPGAAYRGAALLGLGGAGALFLALLAAVAWHLVLRTGVEVAPEEMLAWLNGSVLPGLDTAVHAERAQLTAAPPYVLSVASQPAGWALLVGLGPLVLVSIGHRLRTMITGVEPSLPPVLSQRLDRAEATLAMWGLFFWVGTVLTGALWAEWRWGTFLPGDPRVVLALVVVACLGMYLLSQRLLPARADLPSYFALAAGIACVVGMVGPPLGWTLPSVHTLLL